MYFDNNHAGNEMINIIDLTTSKWNVVTRVTALLSRRSSDVKHLVVVYKAVDRVLTMKQQFPGPQGIIEQLRKVSRSLCRFDGKAGSENGKD